MTPTELINQEIYSIRKYVALGLTQKEILDLDLINPDIPKSFHKSLIRRTSRECTETVNN